MMTCRCETLQPADSVLLSHLQPEGWPDITEVFRFYTSTGFCSPVKLSDGGMIIGTGCSILFEKSAWLAHIIVHTGYRNRGFGSAITDHLLRDILSRGIESALLIATEMGEPVYAKAGFRKVAGYRYFRNENPARAHSISGNIRPYSTEFRSDLLRIDAFISGENRERLLDLHLDGSYLFMDHDAVAGYYIPQLGEGPVYAITPEAGKELMRLKYATVAKASLPEKNYVAIDLLNELGFVETKTKGQRMILGKDIDWKPEMMYARIGGNLG